MMAQMLGRTERSIQQIMFKKGMKSYIHATDDLTVSEIQTYLGINYLKTERWIREGLPMREIGNCRMISQKDLIKHLKTHQDEWNADKVKDDTIFMGEKWYLDKRKHDKGRTYFWKPEEVKILKKMYRDGRTFKEISKVVGRSVDATHQKIQRLRAGGWKL